jgi:hypothetical protein
LSLRIAQDARKPTNSKKWKRALYDSQQRDLVGFCVRLQRGNFRFQDRRLQPLGHPSGLSKFNWQAGARPTLNGGELLQGAERINFVVFGVLFCGGDFKHEDSSQKFI